jgi:DNA repair exonuclease SbcCD ATPase subunit
MINQNNLDKHNKLVEEINSDIDGLLNEINLSPMELLKDAGAYLTGGPAGVIRRRGAKHIKDELEKEKKKKEKELKEKKKKEGEGSKEDKETKEGINSLRDEIAELKRLIIGLKDKNTGDLYSYIEIDFPDEIILNIKKYGVKELNRKLVGRMFFNVDTINDKSRYIDMRTKSLEESFYFRLHYKTLDIFEKQSGRIRLIYKSGKQKLKGDDESCNFEIKSLK